ncbi:phosphatidylserine decarboxylase-domain-containing protein [Mycena metata]|uniref:Phosphatidylserine decarboxylase-domain-containing protein n=1 Tax=Mycena metata TaxID=1033252 RepID=A0AAD7N575_9AGAR|nr:phosphatidylserine decarboxylase-domain-containing protein [Mycena metata]
MIIVIYSLWLLCMVAQGQTLKPDKTTLIRYGGWLPSSKEAYDSFFSQLSDKISDHRAKALPHIPAVAAFAKAMNHSCGSDPTMIDLWNQIFVQAAPENEIKNFDSLLRSLDIVLVQPPGFIVPRDSSGKIIGEPLGVPVYIIFDLLTNTAAAYELFRKPAFNVAMKKLLDSWGAYLRTHDSAKTLNTRTLVYRFDYGLAYLQAEQRGDFNSTYISPKPEEMDRGFASWDDFFVREFQPAARPIHSSSDPAIDAGIIVSACESAVLRLDHNVQLHDQFWLKGQKYSLHDMLDRNQTALDIFIGGTVYQAFLSPADYHRWHSPISGTIVNAVVVPGTYYAAWLTQSATRAIIYIQADNPKIGLVGFIAVGMVEVSTCTLAVKAGQRIEKGAELGSFHFGGSTHVLVFGPNTNITFNDDIVDPVTGALKVNTHIKWDPLAPPDLTHQRRNENPASLGGLGGRADERSAGGGEDMCTARNICVKSDALNVAPHRLHRASFAQNLPENRSALRAPAAVELTLFLIPSTNFLLRLSQALICSPNSQVSRGQAYLD